MTARPNFQDSLHVGYVSGLKKFAEYDTSVLCFTAPGDGPRSPPRRLRTHEDSKWPRPLLSWDGRLILRYRVSAPGAVGHLSFTDILDTSLKVSWKEPLEKNGLITGD